MGRKLVFIMFLAILLTNLLGITIKVEKVKASGTIYIRADGSIDPPTPNIITADNVTYTFTDDNYDSIVVERNNIVVDGAGYTLQGTGSGYGVTLLGRSNVTVRNIEITAFVIGVWLNSSSSNTISGNNITNNAYGLYLYASSSYNTVSGNNITDNGNGVILYSSSSNTISGNSIIANNFTGVYLYSSSSYNTVSGNNITDNDMGVILSSSSSNIVSGNNIIANNSTGLYLYSSSSNIVSDNHITDSDTGVCFYASSSNTISGNHITDNDWYGVYLHNSCNNSTVCGNSFVDDGLFVYYSFGNVVVDNLVNGQPLVYLEDASDVVVEDAGQVILVNCNRIRVENLTLSNTSVGAQLWNTSSTTIAGNNITGNVEGVFLHSSSSNTISGNHITDNEIGSRFYSSSSNNTVSGNSITNNSDAGVYIYASSSNTVSGNNITDNGYQGIYLLSSSDSSISGNDITSNGYGIHLSSSSSNTIHHNNFIDNPQQVYSTNSSNAWDDGYPSGGNYWSNYPDADFYKGQHQNEAGSDGICDHSYVIDELNLDTYPLTEPFGGRLAGDVDGDRDVDIFDIVRMAGVYGVEYPDPRYDRLCDMDLDGDIDIFDIVIAAGHYGESW